MAIVAKQSGETREPVPAGNYFGVIVGVYDIGTQEGGKFGPKHQIVVQFELHKKKGVCRDKEGQPLRISKFYALAFGEKSALRPDVERILGRKFTEEEAKEGYDVTQLLEKTCRLVVTHDKKDDGSVRDQIDQITSLDEDDPEITPESDSVVYELDPERGFDDTVPEWIQKMAQRSAEWQKANGKAPARSSPAKAAVGAGKPAGKGKPGREPGEDDDDDNPF